MQQELVTFAARYGIPASVAYVLPALFERTAQLAGMEPRALLARATYSNPALGEYLAEAARKVAREDGGAK